MPSPSPSKAILITGGAQRLGRAMALHFAQNGWDIALHYHRSEAPAAALADEIRALGRQCALLQADLRESASLRPLVDQAFAAMPHLCALINNASAFPAATLASTDAALLEQMSALHLHAPILLTQAFAEHCPHARVVMMGDSGIRTTKQGHFAYLLSKQALMQATRMLARALAPQARVNALCPGTILPELGGSEEQLQKRASEVPFAATASVADVCDTALYLATQGPLTGHVLFVDGGEHLL